MNTSQVETLITIGFAGDSLVVTGVPYSPDFQEGARELKAWWNPENKTWNVDKRFVSVGQLEDLVISVFGRDHLCADSVRTASVENGEKLVEGCFQDGTSGAGPDLCHELNQVMETLGMVMEAAEAQSFISAKEIFRKVPQHIERIEKLLAQHG